MVVAFEGEKNGRRLKELLESSGTAACLLVPERPGLLRLPAPAGRRELLAAVEELLRLGEEAGALLPPRRSREEREVVERAKERLMARNGMTEEEAHRALRRRSMDRRIPLADAARMLLDEERPAP